MFSRKTMKTTAPVKPVSMLEALESRQLCSASPGLDAGAAPDEANLAVTVSGFSFTQKVNKGSPGIAASEAPKNPPPPPMKITLSDVLISSYS
jgi:hypothetical protein